MGYESHALYSTTFSLHRLFLAQLQNLYLIHCHLGHPNLIIIDGPKALLVAALGVSIMSAR